MSIDASAAFNFTDFQGLAALRREAGQDTPEARRAVAKQFESLFLSLVLTQMRSAGAIDGGLADGEGVRFYQDLHDRQLALALAEGRGIGLADAIMRQLGGAPASPATGASMGGIDARALPTAPSFTRSDQGVHRADEGRSSASRRIDPAGDAELGASREAFVAAIWPHAERAAAELGVPAEVLVAQAALETGWGRHVIRDADGRSTYNVFGIKAGGSWEGRRATVETLEFVDGLPEKRREPFRAYDSLAEGFEDYVALVGRSARYAEAVGADTPEAYARALAAGGYSTDPRYAEKIIAIVERGLPGVPLKPQAVTADTRRIGQGPEAGLDGRGGST